MRITFVTTQSLRGSTVLGRVLPLAEELSKHNQVFVIGHNTPSRLPLAKGEKQWGWISIGHDPFTRTPSGKHRQRGLALIFTMLTNAITAAVTLVRLQPDTIIIVKSLPENVLAMRLATFFFRPKKIILDVDDFELTANQLTSWLQRAAIHWAQRLGARLAHHIAAATPFLADHFEQLTQGKKKVTMIPTGLPPLYTPDVYKGVHIGSEVPVLIYAGSVSTTSGHRVDLLPEILELVRHEVPNAELHIYGTGDDERKLKEIFVKKNLADAVIWHGRFAAPYEGEVLANAREGVLIDPIDNSITARAKSSFRVALAAAAGLPVVTSDIGIRPYLLPGQFHERCFAKPADAADYAVKVVAFIRQPLTQAEQNHMRQHAERHSWLRLTQEYEKIIAD